MSVEDTVYGVYDQLLAKLPNISEQDVYYRLLTSLPNWWGTQKFNEPSNFNTVLQAFITTVLGSNRTGEVPGIYGELQYVLDQTRLGPDVAPLMTDVQQLNLFAQDFFGNLLPRNANENNATYKLRIYANLFNERATRPGMADALYNLTGYYPRIFEPWNINDAMIYCGYFPNPAPDKYYYPHRAYGSAYYGSAIAYTAWITVYLPSLQGMGTYPGYNIAAQPSSGAFPPYPTGGLAGYNLPAQPMSGSFPPYPPQRGFAIYGSLSLLTAIVTQAQVLQVINSTKVEGTKIWFQIIYVTPNS